MLPAGVMRARTTMRACVGVKRHRTGNRGSRSIPRQARLRATRHGTQRTELVDLVHYQIGALDGIARAHGARVTYVKPHGALYHAMLADP